ncbi:hypothetical protein MLD38_031217 [Melastoma candidum]|uniref:Uncharacterized protein n=1 Tax=Melastoma candidum TaxID=119954 RepID=A0ACB9MP12_9MYRT|nr:hypothetical protein MLD38_031217 [Melastoma candidum]
MEKKLPEGSEIMEFGGKKSHHFVLVHGACHGAWCWYKVSALLRSSGHRVSALDMEASGIHPKQVRDVGSMADYVRPLMEFMDGVEEGDKVVLVGHSMGGIPVSMALESFPEKVSVAVYAAALMTGPSLSRASITQEFRRSTDSIMDSTFYFDDGPENPPTSFLFGIELLSKRFYQLSPPEDMMLASYLVRPTRLYADTAGLTEDTRATQDRYRLVDRVYIMCDQDLIIKEDFQRWIIEKNPPTGVKMIPGSDHMVMFSKPRELCSMLEDIARDYANDM